MTKDEIKARYLAQETVIRHIENRVKDLDQWATESAAKGDYSGAGSNQKSAVDLHCAVAIIKEALFPHYHTHSGFDWMRGDTCPGCELDEFLTEFQKGEGRVS